MNDPDHRPDPDALLRRLQAEEPPDDQRRAEDLLRLRAGRRQDVHHARVGPAPAPSRASTSSSAASRPTAARRPRALLDGTRGPAPAHDPPTAAPPWRSSISTRPSRAGRRSCSWTSWPTPTRPSSRHQKRWQDALELLEAGISVHTTLNVQHVESLNDVVAQITTVHVRETVPDSLLERADEIELVDLPAEELLERLRDGKVYLPDRARAAVDHFFRRGNLLALRELALRQAAQRVDEDVQAYRQAYAITDTWPAGERILVASGPARRRRG